MQADILIHAQWVLPVDPADRVLTDHALAIGEGRILALVPSAQARAEIQARQMLELPGHVLIPGLINAHTHSPMTLMRGLADDLPLMTWLNEHIWPAERRWVDPDFVAAGTRLAALEMLRSGTTCFNDMYFYPEVTGAVVAEAGMRALVGMIVLDFPTSFAEGADDYLRKGLELHERYRGHPLVRTAFAPHSPYAVSDGPLARVQTLADELEVQVHIHLHETHDEVFQSLRDHGQRPLARLDRLGLVGPGLVAVHMTQVEDAEMALLAEAAASNNDLDMLSELRVAALLGKGVAGSASAVPARAALRMATIDAACALGMDAEIGSLEPGKAADLVALDLRDPDTQPVYQPLSQLVYAASRDQVRHVWVAGRQLIRDGVALTLDREAILSQARDWGARIAAADRRG